MANDKDFLLKNAVEVGGPTKVTLGSITSSDIDLATGNYFAETLAANTTYTISNAGDVQSFQLEVTGSFNSGYALDSAFYDRVSFSVNSQDTQARGLAFNNDGTKMYMIGSGFDSIYQYSLSTAFAISTASYDFVSFSVTGQDTQTRDIAFNNDGTKMYMVGITNDSVHQYTLSTAFDLSTASYDSVSFSVASQEANPFGIAFNNDGTKLYMVGGTNRTVYQYTLSTAFDLSTASYDSVSFSVASQTASPEGMVFKPDGTKMYLVESTNDSVHQYSLSTAFDLSTASYDSISLSVAGQADSPHDIVLNNDGTKMYIIDFTNDVIYQYTMGVASTITWPSSIEWPYGLAPEAPANDETDLFTIVTDDGGTSYVGLKTADNLS